MNPRDEIVRALIAIAIMLFGIAAWLATTQLMAEIERAATR
jgi:hypothetical protein